MAHFLDNLTLLSPEELLETLKARGDPEEVIDFVKKHALEKNEKESKKW